MRKLATALALFAALLWSAAVWGGYALIGWTGDLVAQNAGTLALPAEVVELAAWARLFAENFGQGAAMVLWLLGIGLIAIALLAVNLVLGRLVPRPQPQLPTEQVLPPAAPPPPAWGRQASGR